jgi:alpha-ribazole phosphatase/probable phosphoglycerate mutase
VFLDWRLRECNYGDLNGALAAEVARVRPRCVKNPFPGGQSYREVVENTRSFLSDLRREFDGRRVCVIAHTANKWALDVLLNGAQLEDLLVADFGWREGWEYTVA